MDLFYIIINYVVGLMSTYFAAVPVTFDLLSCK